MTVLILADRNDYHANVVLNEIVKRGSKAYIWDTIHFPISATATLLPKNGKGSLRLENEVTVKFDDIQSVYWRNYNLPARMSQMALNDYQQSKIAMSDSESLLESIFNCIRCQWYNGLDGYRLHFRKPETLYIAADLGLRIPNSIISNNLDDIRHFVQEFPECIFKPVTGGAHAKRLLPEHISNDNANALKLAPVTIQEEIRGTNIRVFVIGEKLFACEIKSKDLDFRDDECIEIVEVEIPVALGRQCLDVSRALHLQWTGIDFRLDNKGDYYFLEANFSPMFLGFESRTRQPITHDLIDLLLST